MEKKKNIILIQGKDRVGVENEVNMLIRAFRERQNDTNIEIFELSTITEYRTIEQHLLSVWLFVEKRFFVFKGNFTDKKEAERDAFFLKILKEIDSETFIVFVPDDEISWTLGLWIKENGDIRSFSDLFSEESWKKRFPTLDDSVIREVIRKYSQLYALYEEKKKPKNTSLLISETFVKLSLLKESAVIQWNDIDDSIVLEWSGKLFDFIDAILAQDVKQAWHMFHLLANETTMQNFLPGFITLFRSSVYVRYLKQKNYSEGEIVKILKLHPYVAKKSYSSRIPWPLLRDFYDKIVQVNIAYRSGKWLHDHELWRIFSIERAIMSLKK